MKRKKNMRVYIDGENISFRYFTEIKEIIKKQGLCDYAKVYGRQKDERTKGWTELSKHSKEEKIELKNIRLFGPPEKDKVDKKIIKDIAKDISEDKSIDIVCLISSDKGFTDCIKNCRERKKRVVVIGKGDTAQKLREASNKFIML